MGGKVLNLKTDGLVKEIREEVAIRMLKRGNCSLEEIANDTQLSLEQIKKIKEELQL